MPITPSERLRNEWLFELVKVYEFTAAMLSHQGKGEYIYYQTELMVMWPDIGYDQEHAYFLN